MSDEQSTTKKAAVSRPSDREIRVERIFEAPRERVWAAFTDPEAVPQWWGPRKYTAVVEEMDVRPGGVWRVTHRGPDGEEHRFRGVYREVTPPERLVQTFEWEGMPGHVSVETATLEDLGERTKLVSVTIFHTGEERDSMLESGMEEGMNESYERLDELLAA
jgi:uncharacterized protein YndB with AHSA1/START domain